MFRNRRERKAQEREEQRKRIERENREAGLLAAATCKAGDTEQTVGVVHAWKSVERGEDRRGPAEGWPRGRIRWYTSYKCAKCGASKIDMTEWDEP
jgi:hypothetical protein